MAETTDRGMIDFLGKKEEKPEADEVMADTKAAQESELKKKEEKHTLVEELHGSHSDSSSSSDEEVEGERKRKKKNKGLRQKIKEKISGEKEGNGTEHKDSSIPAEKCNKIGDAETTHPEEKKGFLEKIKEKLPCQHKKTEDGCPTARPECAMEGHSPGGKIREKKGILEKIKEKLPGGHKNGEDEEKEKEN